MQAKITELSKSEEVVKLEFKRIDVDLKSLDVNPLDTIAE
jgi:hypothetical protein